MGSGGLHTNHGIGGGGGHRTFLAGRQLYECVNKPSPSDDIQNDIELVGVGKHTSAVPKANGALDRFSNSHLGQDSGADPDGCGGESVSVFGTGRGLSFRGDVPSRSPIWVM